MHVEQSLIAHPSLTERHLADTLSLIKRIDNLREGLHLVWQAAERLNDPTISKLADMYLANDFDAGRVKR